VISTETEDGYVLAGPPERLARDAFGAGAGHLEREEERGGGLGGQE
jgi:hypothetical protein